MSLLRVVIADDERPARQRLQDLIEEAEDAEVAAVCSTGREAVEAIREHEPDLVLLDVQMPGLNGFDVVQEVGPENMPVTIFVTAYSNHALRAFEVSAVDYLLKPFEDERFFAALQRARKQIRLEAVDALRGRLLDLLDATEDDGKAADVPAPEQTPNTNDEGYLERIPVRKAKEIRIVPVTTVAYVQSDGPYAELHMGDGATHLIRESMKALEQQLDPSQFCRIHRSTIINLDFVESVEPNYNDRYVVRLVTGTRLDVSRRRRETFEKRFGLSF